MEKEIKNTPGPWILGERFNDDSGNEFLDIGSGPGGRNILRIAAVRAPTGSKECEANARLIAAAPELLGALKNILMAFGPQRISKMSISDEGLMRAAWDEASSAITKIKSPEELANIQEMMRKIEKNTAQRRFSQ